MGQAQRRLPHAIHVAAYSEIVRRLLRRSRSGRRLEDRAEAFKDVVKAARTHLQDAVPMTLGQEFSGYASVVRHGIARVTNALPHLAELPIGGTAAGTGINAPPGFGRRVAAELARRTGLPFVVAPNLFEAMANRDAAVETSGALRTVFVGHPMKIANDLRLLASGDRTGLAEIELPAIQPGSSIMPGKVNPVIPSGEPGGGAGHGPRLTIAVAAMNGNLDLNMMMPVIAHQLLESIGIGAEAAHVFAEKCVRGIRANVEKCRQYAELTASW